MANPSGRKGTYWESRVVDFLRHVGFTAAERRARQGSKDRGDIAGLRGLVIECKNEKRIDLPRYLAEAEAERINDQADFAVVVIPRRNHPVADGYAVMSIEDFFYLWKLHEERR
jgi:Holliday junction resolvase